MQVILPGRPGPDREEYTMPASPRYFATMQLPLLAGREFEQRDRDYQHNGPPAKWSTTRLRKDISEMKIPPAARGPAS